jgi:MATE family multidrug resistance protein
MQTEVACMNNPLLFFKQDIHPLLKLTIPLVLTGVVQSSLSFLETMFLAHLSASAMAAGALVSWLFFSVINLLFGTFNSVNVLIAHKHGAKDAIGISLVLRDGLILALLLVIPSFILFWNMSHIFLWFGQNAEIVPLATSYLHGLAWGLLPKFILILLFELIIGLGHTRLTLKFSILTIPLYIFLSYVLIFGKFGFPKLEIAGAGWGMTIADWICTLAFCIYLFSSKKYRSYIKNIFVMRKPSYLAEILRLGVPMGVMFAIEVGFFFAMALCMGLINIESLAANQITMQFLGPLMGVIFSLAQAITVRMGHEIGAGQTSAAIRASYAGMLLAALFMTIIAFFYWVLPELLISVDFNIHDPNNETVIHIATQFLFIAAFFQIFEAIRIALFGSLRGLKDTKFSLYVSIISFWLIALPMGYLFSLKIQGNGFWCGMVLGAVFSAGLLYWRFKQKIKKLQPHLR